MKPTDLQPKNQTSSWSKKITWQNQNTVSRVKCRSPAVRKEHKEKRQTSLLPVRRTKRTTHSGQFSPTVNRSVIEHQKVVQSCVHSWGLLGRPAWGSQVTTRASYTLTSSFEDSFLTNKRASNRSACSQTVFHFSIQKMGQKDRFTF